jgi:hypothetical protein
MRKPPIGLVPKFVWKERRLCEVKAAIQRYLDAGCRVPPEWIAEYNELIREVDDDETIRF